MENVDISLSVPRVYFICIYKCHIDPVWTVGLCTELVTIGLFGVSGGWAYTCVCAALRCM